MKYIYVSKWTVADYLKIKYTFKISNVLFRKAKYT